MKIQTITIIAILLAQTILTESNCTPGKCTACSVENIDDKSILTCNSCHKSARTKVSEDIYKCTGSKAINPRCQIDKEDPSKGCLVCEPGYMSEIKDGKNFCTTETKKDCRQGTKTACSVCAHGYLLKTDGTCEKIAKPTIVGCEAYIKLSGDVLGCALCSNEKYFVSTDKKTCVKSKDSQFGCLKFYAGTTDQCEVCNTAKGHYSIGAKISSDGKQVQKCERWSSDFWLWIYIILAVVLVTVIVVGVIIIKNRTKSRQADLFDSMINDENQA